METVKIVGSQPTSTRWWHFVDEGCIPTILRFTVSTNINFLIDTKLECFEENSVLRQCLSLSLQATSVVENL
jgi:hypothetical protein